MMRRSMATMRRQDGFTVVEVIIAVLLIAIVVGTIARFSVNSASLQLTAKTRDKQVSVAEGLLEKLQADQSWALTTGAQGCRSKYINASGPAFPVSLANKWCSIDVTGDPDLIDQDS